MEIESEMVRERKHYLDILRIIAIFAVVLMHTSGLFDDNVDIVSMRWHVSVFFECLTSFAVPVFVMISGALILGKSKVDVKKLYTKNIVRFVTAYFFWSFIYTMVFSFIPYYGEISANSIKNLIAGTLEGGYFHLWYMPLIIGLYVLAPILHELIHKSSTENIYYWGILSFIICFIVPLCRNVPLFEHIFGESIDIFSNGFWGAYVLYFVVGYFLDNKEYSEKCCNLIYLLGIVSAVFTIFAVWISSCKSGELIYALRENNTPNVFFMSVALFVFVKQRLANFRTSKSEKIIMMLSTLSFGVYFIHEVFIVKFGPIVYEKTTSVMAIPIIFSVTIVLSYAITWLISKFKPISKYIV